jgi:hypothetical protein
VSAPRPCDIRSGTVRKVQWRQRLNAKAWQQHSACGMILDMVKRSTRMARRNALRAVEEAIGSSLGKNPARPAAPSVPGAEARDPRIERPLRRPKKSGSDKDKDR